MLEIVDPELWTVILILVLMKMRIDKNNRKSLEYRIPTSNIVRNLIAFALGASMFGTVVTMIAPTDITLPLGASAIFAMLAVVLQIISSLFSRWMLEVC